MLDVPEAFVNDIDCVVVLQTDVFLWQWPPYVVAVVLAARAVVVAAAAHAVDERAVEPVGTEAVLQRLELETGNRFALKLDLKCKPCHLATPGSSVCRIAPTSSREITVTHKNL